MKASLLIGGVSLIVIAMMAFAISSLNDKLGVANKEIGNLSGKVIGLEKDIETTTLLADNNKLHNEKFNILKNATDERIQGLRNEFTKKLATGFSASQESPEAFSDSVDIDVNRWMCRISAGTNTNDIQTCVDITADTLENSQPLTITITQENSIYYQEVCENYKYWILEATDDQREERGSEYIDSVAKTYDFCRWSVTGFTPEGWYGLMMPYLVRVEKQLFDQALWIENVREQLVDRENIAAPPPLETKKEE